MLKYLLLIIITIGFQICVVFSQSSNYILEREPVSIPLSPTSASLGKFFQEPVGTYTGIPRINIPLWDIKFGGIRIPIQLDYHAGGIKVDEISSWVGLGWNLSASGNISRVVRGKADKDSYDYTKIEKFRNNLLSPDQKIDYINEILQSQIDSEPDLYYISFPGIECSFIKDQSGEFKTIPIDKNIKINQIDINKWIVTAPNGIKYYFQESTHSENAFENFSSESTSGGNLEVVNAVNSWSITKIEDNVGNTVTFQYDHFFYNITNRVSENVKIYANINIWCAGVAFGGTASYSDFSEPILKSIKYGSTTIEFVRDQIVRKDLPGTYSLKQIKILDNNTLLKNYNFYSSYFLSDPESNSPRYYAFKEQDKYRLKLDSIQEMSGNQKTSPYKFNYLTAVKLPNRLSNSQDHWGYHNGKENRDFVTYGFGSTKLGANKDIDHQYSQAFTLSGIKYPTGGESIFEYEGNQIEGSDSYSFKDTTLIVLSIDNTVRGEEKGIYEISENFIIDETKFGSSISISPVLTLNGFKPNDSFEIYLKRSGSEDIRIRNGIDPIKVQNGAYSLYVKLLSEVDPEIPHVASVDISLKTKVEIGGDLINSAGPGIRVKKNTFMDGNVILYQKEYQYNKVSSHNSSGQIGSTPSYFVSNLGSHNVIISENPEDPNYVTTCYWDLFSSYSSYPLATTQGSYVGYSNVTEIIKDLGSTIKKSYYFYNFKDNPDLFFPGYPFPPPSAGNYKKGLLKYQEDYKYIGNNEFKLLKKVSNKYDVLPNSQRNIYGIKVAQNFYFIGQPASASQIFDNSSILVYRTYSDSYKITSDTTFLFEENGQIKEINSYEYNAQYLLKKHTRFDSKNIKSDRFLFYPSDYASNTYLSMATDNLITEIVEDKLYLNGLLTQSLKNTFISKKVNQKNQYLIEKKEAYIKNNLIDYIAFKQFDSYGNPTEIKKLDNPSAVYLWGYNGQYPIAKIENAIYTDILTALGGGTTPTHHLAGQNILNTLNLAGVSDATINNHMTTLRNKLTNSFISTYTYSPLLGLTSMTNPRGITEYYQYDGFQRLKDVLDFEKNVLMDYQYHYRP